MFDLIQERDIGARIASRTMVYLIAHGEPEDESYEKLGEQGQKQALELAHSRIIGGVSRVYSAPEKIAKETAEILRKEFDVPMVSIDCLSDLNRGKNRFDVDILSQLWEDVYAEIKGVECIHEAQSRFGSCMNELVEKHPNDSIAVVAHPLVNTLFNSIVIGGSPQVEDWVYSGFCACASYDVTKKSWSMVMPPDDSFLIEPCSVIEKIPDEVKKAFGL